MTYFIRQIEHVLEGNSFQRKSPPLKGVSPEATGDVIQTVQPEMHGVLFAGFGILPTITVWGSYEHGLAGWITGEGVHSFSYLINISLGLFPAQKSPFEGGVAEAAGDVIQTDQPEMHGVLFAGFGILPTITVWGSYEHGLAGWITGEGVQYFILPAISSRCPWDSFQRKSPPLKGVLPQATGDVLQTGRPKIFNAVVLYRFKNH